MPPSTTSRSCWRRPEAAGPEPSIALHVLGFDPRPGSAVSEAPLTPRERAALAGLRGSRRAEWAASRAAAKECVRRLLGLPSGGRVEVRNDHAGVPWALVGGRRLPLSLSHSPGWAVAAAHTRLRVGVDVESLRPIPRSFSRYFLHPSEVAALDGWGHPPTASLAAWTVKEAVLKAVGQGLFRSPREVWIRSVDAAGSVSVTTGGAEVGASCWRERGAVVAVAWAGTAGTPTRTLSRGAI